MAPDWEQLGWEALSLVQLVQEAAAVAAIAIATAVALGFVTKGLNERDHEKGDQKAQVEYNLAEGMEGMAGLVRYHTDLHLQQHMDHRRDLLLHAHCVTAAHS